MSWHGLITITEIQHIRNNKVIYEDKNIKNTLHAGGELYMLTTCFNNPSVYPPANYYFGLDNRSSIEVNQTIEDISGEPANSPNDTGYARQAVASSGDNFVLETVNGIYRATSKIITFSANIAGNGFGPVSKLFLATSSDNTGILIASNALSTTFTLTPGDSITVRMALSLQDITITV